MGRYRISKIVKKSVWWSKHGKHCSVLMEMRAHFGQKKRQSAPMYSSVRECFDAARDQAFGRRDK